MTEEAKALRREYKRKWNKANPDKVKAAQLRYWDKKAAELSAQQAEEANENKAVKAAELDE